MISQLTKQFIQIYRHLPQIIVQAPGRANIIGEHTDYNNGFVLPFAINKSVYFLMSKNNTSEIRIFAADMCENAVIYADSFPEKSDYNWLKFIKQVLKSLPEFTITGLDIVFGGNLPIGAGVSSSSALTCGFLSGINQVLSLGLSKAELLEKSVIAERGYGVEGGIMDQFTIINGRKDKAILLDCSDNSFEYIDIQSQPYNFWLINTNVHHHLLTSDYNLRHAECRESVEVISNKYKKINSLRDIYIGDLPKIKEILSDMHYHRASFVIEENQRVTCAVKALQNGDYLTLGRLLYQSHSGLSEKYQVSCTELDYLVEEVKSKKKVMGARMMGGGFGGCTINLVQGDFSDEQISDIKSDYSKQFGLEPSFYKISPSDGIKIENYSDKIL